MFSIGPFAFLAPALLTALIALPVLWVLLRAMPPAPMRRRFPGVALLLGLHDDDAETQRTPWWLLVVRMAAVAAVIVGFSGPVLNPKVSQDGTGPLLILLDGSWAGAGDWDRRIDKAEDLVRDAARMGRQVAVVSATDLPPGDVVFQTGDVVAASLPALQPAPYFSEGLAEWVAAREDPFETYWISDGLHLPGQNAALEALEAKGAVTVFQTPRTVFALRPLRFEDGAIQIEALRDRRSSDQKVTLNAIGRDPAGQERPLSQIELDFPAGDAQVSAALALPAELRNRITRLEIAGQRSAGAVALTDDALQRREVALIAGRDDREGLRLLQPLHFLEQALEPNADILTGAIADILPANPDVIVLADVAQVALPDKVKAWVEDGGLLLRFAGQRVAASDIARESEDPLLPVRLRAGGRSVGGAMSWGEPKSLRAFPAGSPFFGLQVPEDVTVSSQVMAQPDPQLAERVIASLTDGTPIVTRKQLGQGQVVLVHVTANAEWSTLPLSGLFVEMLERLAISTRAASPTAEDLVGTTWSLERRLDGFGRLENAGDTVGVSGELLAAQKPGPDLPAGLYAFEGQRLALNVLDAAATLEPAIWPARVPVVGLNVAQELPLKGWALLLGLGLGLLDVILSLLVSGRMFGPRAAIGALAGLMLLGLPHQSSAQDQAALAATTEVVLAHVVTGDEPVDQLAAAGLAGLSRILFNRTSIEPAAPIAVDLERDELAFFPFLYWPISPLQPQPSPDAYAKLNRYLRTGGMILFDTRDADRVSFGAASPEGRRLQELARGLDLPALEPIPEDHVLTRAFYLLQDFPGRHMSREVWVEAAPADAQQVEGMPFRNLNDGVTPIVVGGNDWAAAWAQTTTGQPLVRIGRGFAGERQRELAYRFGVNLMMHVLTGNYKSDQVHVPALLDRLGQ